MILRLFLRYETRMFYFVFWNRCILSVTDYVVLFVTTTTKSGGCCLTDNIYFQFNLTSKPSFRCPKLSFLVVLIAMKIVVYSNVPVKFLFVFPLFMVQRIEIWTWQNSWKCLLDIWSQLNIVLLSLKFLGKARDAQSGVTIWLTTEISISVSEIDFYWRLDEKYQWIVCFNLNIVGISIQNDRIDFYCFAFFGKHLMKGVHEEVQPVSLKERHKKKMWSHLRGTVWPSLTHALYILLSLWVEHFSKNAVLW